MCPKERGMAVKGVLIDFGDTLGHVDEESDRKYREGLLSILRRHGCEKSLEDFSLILGNMYYRSSKGEVKNFNRFWDLLLVDLETSSKPQLVCELEEFRNRSYTTIFRLYEGVIPVLSDLTRKYKLSVVSNCSVVCPMLCVPWA
jgi:FMN phosphatase YigB (HAD superfamily)